MANKHLYRLIALLFGLYFLARFLRVAWSDAPNFIHYHFTDLLFVPLMGNIAWLSTRWVKRDPKLKIPVLYAYVLVVLSVVYFEWYLPNYKSHIHPYTSDPIDSLMYLIGGVVFHFQLRLNLVDSKVLFRRS